MNANNLRCVLRCCPVLRLVHSPWLKLKLFYCIAYAKPKQKSRYAKEMMWCDVWSHPRQVRRVQSLQWVTNVFHDLFSCSCCSLSCLCLWNDDILLWSPLISSSPLFADGLQKYFGRSTSILSRVALTVSECNGSSDSSSNHVTARPFGDSKLTRTTGTQPWAMHVRSLHAQNGLTVIASPGWFTRNRHSKLLT